MRLSEPDVGSTKEGSREVVELAKAVRPVVKVLGAGAVQPGSLSSVDPELEVTLVEVAIHQSVSNVGFRANFLDFLIAPVEGATFQAVEGPGLETCNHACGVKGWGSGILSARLLNVCRDPVGVVGF